MRLRRALLMFWLIVSVIHVGVAVHWLAGQTAQAPRPSFWNGAATGALTFDVDGSTITVAKGTPRADALARIERRHGAAAAASFAQAFPDTVWSDWIAALLWLGWWFLALPLALWWALFFAGAWAARRWQRAA